MISGNRKVIVMDNPKPTRRQFLETILATGAAFTAGGSRLEATVQMPERKTIGKFRDSPNEGSREFGVIDRYSDGVFLTQQLKLGDEYAGEILYFIRNGAGGEFSEWGVQYNLYKAGSPAPVSTRTVEGSLQGGKFITRVDTLDEKKPITTESVLIGGLYDQSSLSELTRPNANIKVYLNYFTYALGQAVKGPFNSMPPNYNPLQSPKA